MRRERKKLWGMLNKAVADARAKRDGRLEGEAYSIWGFEIDIVDWQIKNTMTRALINEADRLFLPVPDENDPEKWEEDPATGKRTFLSPKGIAELRTAIRQEKRERRENIQRWIAILIGLIGALTGLIAVLKS